MINYLNSFAENWITFFSTVILQNTLFLAVIFLVLYLIRDKHAGIRYSVAALGLIKLLLPPFLPLAVRENTATASAAVEVGNISVGVAEATPAGPALSLPGIIFLLWAATAVFMLLLTLGSTLRLRWHLRGAAFISRTNVDGKTIDVYSSANIPVPMSIGLFPKRVYVPPLWSKLSDELRLSLLRHEVAHIRRRDGIFGTLQILAQALYFFHPLVWILNRQANEFREMACDDMAVDKSPVTPLVYSRCLVHVAENMLPSRSCLSASTLIKQKNRLYHRVSYQVKENTMKNISKRRSRLIWALLLILIVPLSWYCKKESAPPPPPVDKANIYGKVTDAESGEILAGANIVLSATNQGAASDANGEYLINDVLPGEYYLACRLIGYRPERVRINAEKGLSVRQDFELELSPVQTDMVTVTADKKDEDEKSKVTFVPYDEPPLPIGGTEALMNNLVYPEEARERGIEGYVIAQAHVNESGKVDDVNILRSELPQACNDAAAEALRKTAFTPAKQGGKIVAVWISVPFKFQLQEKE
ncbi:MAG: M56 family metallopeptidase [Candidatus Neomarinimicrobiota bacterium]|jgi:TonB family protein|nr:M56 family metallopeptidase [Candidatus Neomarinimicrobiota bacterium]MDX9781022.1 M56 family metallopeptidase [bacterium]